MIKARYEELRGSGMSYPDTVVKMAGEFYYSVSYMRKLITKANNNTPERHRKGVKTDLISKKDK